MNNRALVSLTFDDGFRCQFEKALPILDAYDIPATFFLIANQNLSRCAMIHTRSQVCLIGTDFVVLDETSFYNEFDSSA